MRQNRSSMVSLSLVALVLLISGLVTLRSRADDAPAEAKLVVTKATWGDLSSDRKADVTSKVVPMVKDGALSVEASIDIFDDPAANTVKQLQVEYTLNGTAQTRIVAEGVTMVISDKPSKLVITKASYGDLPDGQKADVTEKVRQWVNSDSLSVVASNGNFGDPADGVRKRLTVEYTLEGKAGTKTVDEDETLSIPF
jgi:hypothetical protein